MFILCCVCVCDIVIDYFRVDSAPEKEAFTSFEEEPEMMDIDSVVQNALNASIGSAQQNW